jgi:hypothetical protein
VVVWLWEVVLICVCNNSLVVGGLCSRHPVPGGLRFRVIPRWVRAVFAVKQAVIYARLLRPSLAPATRAIAVALGGYNLDGERPRRWGAGWLCYAPAADCGCPNRSLTAKVLSRFGWTAEGPSAFSETRPCADGALRIWRTSQTTDRALGGFWVGP